MQVRNGSTFKWCSTCTHYNPGDRAHFTLDHVVGFLKKRKDKTDTDKKEEEKTNEALPQTLAPSGNLAAGSLCLASGFLCIPGLKD